MDDIDQVKRVLDALSKKGQVLTTALAEEKLDAASWEALRTRVARRLATDPTGEAQRRFLVRHPAAVPVITDEAPALPAGHMPPDAPPPLDVPTYLKVATKAEAALADEVDVDVTLPPAAGASAVSLPFLIDDPEAVLARIAATMKASGAQGTGRDASGETMLLGAVSASSDDPDETMVLPVKTPKTS
jgi:hypothetical protein